MKLVTINDLIPTVEDFIYYQDNWDYFIEDFILGPRSRAEGRPYEIDEPQREIIQAVNHNKRTTCVTSKGLGKTSLAAWLTLTFMSLYSYPKVAISAPAGSQLDSALWPEIAKWLRDSALEPMFEHTRDRVKYLPKWPSEWLTYRKTPKDETCAQGLHADDMLIIVDEASGVKEESLEAFDGTISDRAGTENNKILLIGNGNRPDGFFFETHTRKGTLEHWKRLSYNAFQSRFRDQKQIDYIESRYGQEHPRYRIEVMGEFPDANTKSFIPYAEVMEAAGRWVEYDKYCKEYGVPEGPVEMGLDCAGDGDDLNVITARKGNYTFKPATLKYAKPKEIYKMVVNYVKDIRDRTGYEDNIKIKIDTTGGYGSGPFERIEDDSTNNITAVKVNFAWKANKNDEYDSIVSEMWDNVRYEMKNIILYPKDNFLLEELYTRQIDSDCTRTKIQSKKAFKKEYHASPDRADSLILAFADIRSDKSVAKEFDHNDHSLVRTVEYTGNESYGSVWIAKDAQASCIYSGWDGFKLQVYDEYFSDAPIAHLGMDISRHSGLTKVIGNKIMFNKNSSADTSKEFKKKYGVRIRENKKFDEISAIETLNMFIRSKKIVIDPRCYNLIEQLKTWKFDMKRTEIESGHGLCLALANLVSLVKDKNTYTDASGFSMSNSNISYVAMRKKYNNPNGGWMAS